MYHHPLVFVLAVEPARQLARSAMPNATVVQGGRGRRRPWRRRLVRRRLALTLHRLADRVQPA
jgi:hypothetical protein